VRRWLPQRVLRVVADRSYAALEFLHACQSMVQPVTVITRLRLDAALYESAPAYGGIGRPPKKGQRLPTPEQVMANLDTTWERLSLPWYGQPKRSIDIASATAVWYHTGLPPVPIRFVLIRDVLGKFKPQALLSTDLNLTALDILTLFMRRWQMEPTFQHVRAHLGVETQRQWRTGYKLRLQRCRSEPGHSTARRLRAVKPFILAVKSYHLSNRPPNARSHQAWP
jgi:hypothetical protein